MGLRCFLFSSDGETAGTIGQVLAGLDVQAETCPDAVGAVEKIANQGFQIVIIDWDKQPEAGLLLTTARERKASERPITLAIVSDDASVPKALQAGANSILRRPLVVNQIKDTLTTARALVRARREPSPAALSAKAAAGAPAPLPTMPPKVGEKALRAGEFLQSASAAPGGSFQTDSDVLGSQEQSSDTQVDPLKDLEPVAASVQERPAPLPPPPPEEPRGLEWYLKARGVTRQAAPPPPPPPPPTGKPELIGFDQTPSKAVLSPSPEAAGQSDSSAHEQKKEAELFAYIDGNDAQEETPRRRFRLGKGAIFTAFLLASIAVAAAPQAPWHPQIRALWSRGQLSLHAWLNPQPVTTPVTPAAHESFARPGDEYKLPVAETIPDATTDPSQIQVVPVVDPTAKKPNPDTANPDQPAPQGENLPVPAEQPQNAPIQVRESPPTPTNSETSPAVVAPVVSPGGATGPAVSAPPHTEPAPARSTNVPTPAPKVYPPPRQPTMPGNIPSSLKSQMASSTPEASGNKPIEAALPSIEPVVVPESGERSLLLEQSAPEYPSGAKGQQGSVVLQVLIGRDGTVQDAKFLQGSFAFARVAIDGVRKWKFKPYILNGRPVSVQTTLTIAFKSGS